MPLSHVKTGVYNDVAETEASEADSPGIEKTLASLPTGMMAEVVGTAPFSANT